ncbi:MAG: alanine--tRNA ligase [Candidatus Doudnabacteria bacterium]|nr:alanine--tRNA ligase [Candidatus Doudnabacteria bacterium]
MTSVDLRKKFQEFFEEKGHKVIPSASLVPKDDPTVLFTTAGMHPLVPYLLGEEHPAGKRLTSIQKSFRTDDIDEVGDETHNTFFEMLGNWSLGDYWKKEAIEWSYEFLTGKKWLGLDKARIAVSVFGGDDDVDRDLESVEIWKSLGIPEKRIAYLGKKDNWWGPPGLTGPCGPDTEMFYWTGVEGAPPQFDPADKKWVEIWNDVFMQFEKTIDGQFVPLKKKNVDTGMGMERMTAVLEGKESIYDTELFLPLIDKARSLGSKQDQKAERIIADHLRASVFLIADGITPSNKDRGYVLRRLMRRAITYGKKIGINDPFTTLLYRNLVEIYGAHYPELKHADKILEELNKEETKFRETLSKGLKLLEKKDKLSGKEAFDLFQSYGFPFELIKELGKEVNENEFQDEFKKHQELSRTASAGQFKGGLTSQSGKVVRLHTATHLMNAALRKVLGEHVFQKGSNINEERTRFDFTHDKKMTEEEKKKVQDFVNDIITRDLPVKKETMPLEDARKLGAIGVFGEKYPDTVSVYTIYDPSSNEIISREFCGGPHVERTGIIGNFKILKEEAVSAGVRRIKAAVE